MKLNNFSWKLIFLIIFCVAVVSGIYIVLNKKPLSAPISSAPAITPARTSSASLAPKSSLFGIMLAYNINDAAMEMSGAVQKGWTEFTKDKLAYENLKSNLKKLIQDRVKLVQATGFSLDRELVPYFTWNIIEPRKGQFDWELTDTYAQAATDAGIKISAVIQPFASWDQKNTPPLVNCQAFDFAYYDYKASPLNDLAEYENFLTKTVERYKDQVAVWEIGNEYDGPCGGYENNPQGYFDLVKITSAAIKKADPQAIVANGGASEVAGAGPGTKSTKNFWTKFFALGGSRYIDYFNFHYNTERSQNAELDAATLEEALAFWNGLLEKNGGRKPLYLTEFGIYSGRPSSEPISQESGQVQASLLAPATPPEQSPNQPAQNGKCGDGICDDFEKQNSNACPQDCGGSTPSVNQGRPSSQPMSGQTLRNLSQAEQAALYFEYGVLAFANGAKTVFIDLVGLDDSVVGSSMAFKTDGQPRLFLATLKSIENKINGFSDVKKIAAGQYKFTIGNKDVYALWSGKIPFGISGQIKVTNLQGEEKLMIAPEIKFSSQAPVLLEVQRQ